MINIKNPLQEKQRQMSYEQHCICRWCRGSPRSMPAEVSGSRAGDQHAADAAHRQLVAFPRRDTHARSQQRFQSNSLLSIPTENYCIGKNIYRSYYKNIKQ